MTLDELVEQENAKLDAGKVLVKLLERLVTTEAESHWRPSSAINRDRDQIKLEAQKLKDEVGEEILIASADLLSQGLYSLALEED